jgi:hypothetical protein
MNLLLRLLVPFVLFVPWWLFFLILDKELSCADSGRYDRQRIYERRFCCVYSPPGLPGPPEAS